MSQSRTDASSARFSLERIGGRTLRVARWHGQNGGNHTPLLFFNGIGANAEALAPLAEALRERPVIAIDMPGTGGSPDPLVPYNPALMAWTARQLLRRDGFDQADIMGLSWGGIVAQQFALQHSGATRRLVLAATNAGMVAVPGHAGALWKLANPANWKGRGLGKVYGQLMGAGREDLRRLTPPSMRGYLYQAAALTGWTSAPFLPFIKAPTLIMAGDADRIVPPVNGRILNALIPGSRLEMFKGGGHLFLLSQRKRALAVLRAFLDDKETRR